MVRDGSVEPTAVWPEPEEDLPEGHSWVVMQHFQAEQPMVAKGYHLQFPMLDSWVVPGQISKQMWEAGQQPNMLQWSSNAWLGAEWADRTIKVI